MSTYLFAGGGSAGHVNPLLATADRLLHTEPDAEVIVLGTSEGLERELVPAHGLELATIPKLPFPRRPDAAALKFARLWAPTVRHVRNLIRTRNVSVVVGFGGYASAPAYRAAHLEGVPIVIHEANARPGMANRLGARWTSHVGLTYTPTTLPGTVVGMPLRTAITELDRAALRPSARAQLGLEADRPTLLVTGGSQGARAINQAIVARAGAITDAGWQILHLSGGRQTDFTPAAVPHYVSIEYLSDMHLAYAAADLVIGRSGSLTVAEVTAVGLPAIYVPLPFGNGEQALNAHDQVTAGGAVLVDNASFTPEWIDAELIPLLRDPERVREMAQATKASTMTGGDERMCALIREAKKESR